MPCSLYDYFGSFWKMLLDERHVLREYIIGLSPYDEESFPIIDSTCRQSGAYLSYSIAKYRLVDAQA